MIPAAVFPFSTFWALIFIPNRDPRGSLSANSGPNQKGNRSHVHQDAHHCAPDARKSITVKSDPTRIDPLKLKLGKQPPRHDPRTLLFASYTTPALPAPPASLDLTTKVKSPGA